jgi:hypothetical protein
MAEYFANRANEEREASLIAPRSRLARIHAESAIRYRLLASELEANMQGGAD